MKCPYCGQEMKLGRLRSASGYGVFWLPEGSEFEGLLTGKRIEESGGVLLDPVTKIGFFAKEKPESWWCPCCRIFLTKKL